MKITREDYLNELRITKKLLKRMEKFAKESDQEDNEMLFSRQFNLNQRIHSLVDLLD